MRSDEEGNQHVRCEKCFKCLICEECDCEKEIHAPGGIPDGATGDPEERGQEKRNVLVGIPPALSFKSS